MTFDFCKKPLFWQSGKTEKTVICIIFAFLHVFFPEQWVCSFFGEILIFNYHSIDPIRYLTYLFLCILLLFLGKERAVLGTFHDSVIFLDQNQDLCAPAAGKLTWFCRFRIFLEGLQQLAWRCKGCSIIIYGRNLKCVIITLVNAGGSSATIRNF